MYSRIYVTTVTTLHAAISSVLTDKAHLMPMFIPHRGVCNDSEMAESTVFPLINANGLERSFVPFPVTSKRYHGYILIVRYKKLSLHLAGVSKCN
jgi:hypothetical protein